MARDTRVPIKVGASSQKGHAPNKCLPRFVGDAEIKSLRKVVDEKNAVIEKFKASDEEQKTCIAGLQKELAKTKEEYADLKEFADSFKEELEEVFVNNDISQDDYSWLVKIFGQWYTYKNHSKFYLGKLQSASSCIRDLKDDLTELEEITKGLGNIRSATKIADRFLAVRQHFDNLASMLMV